MIKIKIFGIEVKISFLFICFISWLLIYNNNKITLICILSSVFHEAMHLLTLTIFYIKPKNIYIRSYGISIKKEKELPFAKEIIVLTSGPFGNLILFLISLFLNLKTLTIVNLSLLIFNIIPAENLDGGQIFSLLAFRLLSYETYIKLTKIIFFCSQILIIVSTTIMFKFFNNLTILISFILFIFSFIIDEI